MEVLYLYRRVWGTAAASQIPNIYLQILADVKQ